MAARRAARANIVCPRPICVSQIWCCSSELGYVCEQGGDFTHQSFKLIHYGHPGISFHPQSLSLRLRTALVYRPIHVSGNPTGRGLQRSPRHVIPHEYIGHRSAMVSFVLLFHVLQQDLYFCGSLFTITSASLQRHCGPGQTPSAPIPFACPQPHVFRSHHMPTDASRVVQVVADKSSGESLSYAYINVFFLRLLFKRGLTTNFTTITASCRLCNSASQINPVGLTTLSSAQYALRKSTTHFGYTNDQHLWFIRRTRSPPPLNPNARSDHEGHRLVKLHQVGLLAVYS